MNKLLMALGAVMIFLTISGSAVAQSTTTTTPSTPPPGETIGDSAEGDGFDLGSLGLLGLIGLAGLLGRNRNDRTTVNR